MAEYLTEVNGALFESANVSALLPVQTRLNSRQAAKTNEMQHVSWDLILIHGLRLKRSSPLLPQKPGSR